MAEPKQNISPHRNGKSAHATILITLLLLPGFPGCGSSTWFKPNRNRAWRPPSRYQRTGTGQLPGRHHPPVRFVQSSPIHSTAVTFPRRAHSENEERAVVPYLRSPELQQAPQLHHPQIYHHRILSQSPKRQDFHPLQKMMTKKVCKGRKNLLDDIGLLSLITAVVSSTVGLYTILFNSMPSNNIGIAAGFISLALWLPSTLISLFHLDGDFVYFLGNLLTSLSFINSMYGTSGVIFGTLDVLASSIGESIGIFSFVLSVIATFPTFLDAIIEHVYQLGGRQQLEHMVENYGCSVPGLFRLVGKPLYNIVNDFLVHAIAGMTPLDGARLLTSTSPQAL